MTILQAGFPKSGNLWLWRTISALLEEADAERSSYLEGRGDLPSMPAEELSFTGQETVDVLDIDPGGVYVRVGYAYREPVNDLAEFLKRTSQVWTHSPILEETADVIKRFDRIIYIIRDPRDVAVSMSRFKFTPYMLANDPPGYEGPQAYLAEHLVDLCRDWAKHVLGYLRWKEELDIHVVFYENMVDRFDGQLQALADFLGLGVDEAARSRIAAAVSVEAMKAENPGHVRKGGWGGWREALNEAQQERVEGVVGPLLEVLGYPLASVIDSSMDRPLLRPSLDGLGRDEVRRLSEMTRRGWRGRVRYALDFIRDPRPWSAKLKALARLAGKPGELFWKLK